MPRFAFAAGPLVSIALAVACSSSSSGVGAGGECEIATDCADGLVCVPQKDGSRVCSSDLSGVQKTPPAPPSNDAGNARADAAGAGDDASQSDAPTSTPDAPTGTADATGD